jgi:ubiquinone/menaquinone biosynthesis C-methylase UbiE
MQTQQTLSETNEAEADKPLERAIKEALKSKQVKKPYREYRQFIQDKYDGFAGNLMSITGFITGHGLLAGQVFKPDAFDLRGCKRILDAGCGNGRHIKYILRWGDPDAFITAFDLSHRMLIRSHRRLKSDRIRYLTADLTRLPYPDASFDAIVCGWVLEHIPDPRLALSELSRVLQPGGKLLLMTTEDTVWGAVCSNLWHCRTYNRTELRQVCEETGLVWHRPLYFTKLHRFFKLGGIIMDLRKV